MPKDKGERGKKAPRTNLEKSLEGLQDVGRGDFVVPREGKNTWRILPWKDVFFFRAVLHYGMKGPGGGKKDTAYPCLLMFGKKSCPACDFQEGLSQSSKEGKLKLANRIRPVTKYYVNVLDRDRVKEGIKMYGFSTKMMRTLRGFLEDEDYGDITDPEDGKDVIVTREGTSFTSTSYELRVRAKSTPLDYENWEDEIHDLSTEIVKEISKDFLERRIEDLKKLIKGEKPSSKEEEEEEEEKEEEKKEEEDDEEED